MSRIRLLLLALLAAGLVTIQGVSQSPNTRPKVAPRLVPVAETKLLMEGLAHPNFQGLQRILKNEDIDKDSWTFARGQALLIAETGNLLLMRPPNNSGQDAWMKNSMDMRDSATELARVTAARDRRQSRAALVTLSNSCNNCHQKFQVATSIKPFEEQEEKKP
jgi:hypothetical protein